VAGLFVAFTLPAPRVTENETIFSKKVTSQVTYKNGAAPAGQLLQKADDRDQF
jgi:hypothetical protein